MIELFQLNKETNNDRKSIQQQQTLRVCNQAVL